GEAVYDTDPVDVGETVLFGRACRRENSVYLIIRFWPGSTLRLQGLATEVERATLLGSQSPLKVTRDPYGIQISGLPETQPNPLFSVIKLELNGAPRTLPSYHPGLWGGDPARLLPWALTRGHSVMARPQAESGKTLELSRGPSE
ncbi:MAG: alpha-L-fucosidase, partial [Puniceicoccales bacterium]